MKVSPLGCWARRVPGKRPLPRRHPAENGAGGAPPRPGTATAPPTHAQPTRARHAIARRRRRCRHVRRVVAVTAMAVPEVLRQLSRRAWEPALARAHRAAVLMDAPSAEALHWAGGAGELLAAGALAVSALSAEAAVPAGAARAVFVVSGTLRGGAAAAVRGMLERGAVRHCVLLCGDEADGGGAAELEETLRRWMGEGGRAEVVLRGPPLLAPVSAELCLLPALAALLPPLPGPGGPGPAEVGLGALPAELREAVRALVGELDSLFTALGLREESFAVGALSRVIAAELASYASARNRRRTATNKASVIFVDRTLDLAGKKSSAGMGCHSVGPIPTPPGGCHIVETPVSWCYQKSIFHFVQCPPMAI